ASAGRARLLPSRLICTDRLGGSLALPKKARRTEWTGDDGCQSALAGADRGVRPPEAVPASLRAGRPRRLFLAAHRLVRGGRGRRAARTRALVHRPAATDAACFSRAAFGRHALLACQPATAAA